MGRRGTSNIIHLALLPTTITPSDIPNEYAHYHNYVCYSKTNINATYQQRYCRPTVREYLYSTMAFLPCLFCLLRYHNVSFAFCRTGSAFSAQHDVLRPDGTAPLFVGQN